MQINDIIPEAIVEYVHLREDGTLVHTDNMPLEYLSLFERTQEQITLWFNETHSTYTCLACKNTFHVDTSRIPNGINFEITCPQCKCWIKTRK